MNTAVMYRGQELRVTPSIADGMAELRRLTDILTIKDQFESSFLRSVPLVLWGKAYEAQHDQFRMVFISDHYTKIFGVERGDYIAKLDSEVWPPDVAAVFRAQDMEVMRTGRPVFKTEPTPLAIDPAWRNCMTMKFPIYDKKRNISGVGGVAWPADAEG